MTDEAGDPGLVSLIDETGTERRFRLHDAIDLEGSTYYLVEATDDADLVLVLKEVSGGLETVDEEEFARVMATLESEG